MTSSELDSKIVAFLTKHKKDFIIKPYFEELGFKLLTINNWDTDQLGTFSGEIERPAGQLETAILKAKQALNIESQAGWGLGSEGAFNPHPLSPFITLNTEILVLLERNSGCHIKGRAFSSEVFYKQATIENLKDLENFVKMTNFPEYGVILKVIDQNNKILASEKESTTIQNLFSNFEKLKIKFTDYDLIAEVDLRAHRNPARRKVIDLAAKDLINRLKKTCPKCGRIGFGLEKLIPGLPCIQCGFPTSQPKGEDWQCPFCGYNETQTFDLKTLRADPSSCNICNP